MPNQPKAKKIQDRWPGKYVIKATIFTPMRNRLDIETDLTDEDGEQIMMMLTAAVGAGEEEDEEPGENACPHGILQGDYCCKCKCTIGEE